MAIVAREAREPAGVVLALVTGVVNLAIGVRPWLALLATIAVFVVKVTAGAFWPAATPPAVADPTAKPAFEPFQDKFSKLSPAELRVGDLVTQGLTNKEIARRLFLSERTVDNHVQHILNKLDVQNRAQIAAEFVRHGRGTVEHHQ